MAIALKDMPPAARRRAIAAGAVQEAAAPKRSKFGNVPTEVDGITFHSAKESRHYTLLKMLERAGKLTDLVLQPRFPLHVADTKGQQALITTYVADFAYTVVCPRSVPVAGRTAGERVVVDVKSEATEADKAFVIKRALFEALTGQILAVV